MKVNLLGTILGLLGVFLIYLGVSGRYQVFVGGSSSTASSTSTASTTSASTNPISTPVQAVQTGQEPATNPGNAALNELLARWNLK